MKISVVNGMLCMIAETPKDGYELSKAESTAKVNGKVLKVDVSEKGVAATVRLPELGD